MIEAVDFVSRDEFQKLRPAPGWAAISLGNPAEFPPANLEQFEAFIRLEFLDLTPEALAKYDAPEEALCQPEQVQEAIRFIERLHQAAAPVRLVVHCRMGLSRSPAFGLLVHALTGCSFPRRVDSGFANRHVLQLVQAQTGLSIDLPGYPHEPQHGPALLI